MKTLPQSFGSVTANHENPSTFYSDRILSPGGGGQILFLANGGETSTVNCKCSLKMGCTREPKVSPLFHVHLAYPRQGSQEQLCPSLTEILSSALYQHSYASGNLEMREQHKA